MEERPFGLMFHYFHGEGHSPGQGTLSSTQFEEILDRYLAGGRLRSAKQWTQSAEEGCLRPSEVCITFDDALRSQFDIALPVLRRKGLTALWFVQSGVLTGEIGLLEAYRIFRNKFFPTMLDFYRAFCERACSVCAAESVAKIAAPIPSSYLREFAFYTQEDRRFRYIRDNVLRTDEYQSIMQDLISSRGTTVEELSIDASLDSECLRTLENEGHVIGLHSHSHPTNLADLAKERQREEYVKNFQVLREILVEAPFCMAHPCNSYSTDTLEILRDLGIRIGFRSNMTMQHHSRLEFPRVDCADLQNRMDGSPLAKA
jgi:peptidoglycan/xylan/chitin deacetylase (PgdA/CDA1 family)